MTTLTRWTAPPTELGLFFDHLRQVGIRSLVAEQLNDADYLPGRPPGNKKAGK